MSRLPLYERVESWVKADLPVLVTGTPRESGPACELTVQEITPLEGISERLAQGGIDIHHIYATASITQEQTLVVFASANNDRAMVLMNAAPNAT